MTKLRGIRYSLIFLKIINFIAILFSSSLYLHATNYIIAKGQGYQLLEHSLPFIGCVKGHRSGQFLTNGIF